MVQVTFSLQPSGFIYFYQILRQGFLLPLNSGLSIQQLLEKSGIPPKYIQQKIQTIFLNGSPVDDPGSVYPGPGSDLALSAAMPGLVGATLRKGGIYAPMRESITRIPQNRQDLKSTGLIQIRLFNFTAPEIGPIFLSKGILLNRERFKGFVQGLESGFWRQCRSAQVDGKEVSKGFQGIKAELSSDELVLLRVLASEN